MSRSILTIGISLVCWGLSAEASSDYNVCTGSCYKKFLDKKSELDSCYEKCEKLEAEEPNKKKASSTPKLEKKFSAVDLAMYLLPLRGGLEKLDKNILYTGVAFQVFQKVPGGYLFSIYRPYWSNVRAANNAFLKTKANISPNGRFCAWFNYTGSYSYTALNGFKQSIPAFKIYNGESPLKNGHCPNRVLEPK